MPMHVGEAAEIHMSEALVPKEAKGRAIESTDQETM